MRKLFSLLALTAVVLMLMTGLGIYWFSANEIGSAKANSAAAEAKSIALSLSAQINLLNMTLDKMAQDPEVLNAIAIGNSGLLRATADKLEKYIPDVLKIRLLLPETNEIDEQSKPRMGYADLVLVRETFNGNKFPGIQGDKGVDRHLAIARGISQNGKVVGVILASFDEGILLKSLQLAKLSSGHYELKQGTIILGEVGNPKNNDSDPKQLVVPNTDWTIHYQYAEGINMGNISIVGSIIIVPTIIMLLFLLSAYRWLSNTLAQDLLSVMTAFKDIMANKATHGHYPVELVEMNAAVSNLMQFKRVIDYSDHDYSPDTDSNTGDIVLNEDDDFDLDDLFADAGKFKL